MLHLVGYILEYYYDARTHERQIPLNVLAYKDASHHVLSDTPRCMLNTYVRNSRCSVVLNVHNKLY